MATAPIRTDHRPISDGGDPPAREARLAELVAGLTTVGDEAALDAVRAQPAVDDPLEVVARALTTLRHETEPEDRFRVVGFLRPDRRRLPRRPRSGDDRSGDDRPDPRLVHHGSLRRWERTATDVGPDDGLVDPPADHGGDVIDLRDRTARFRRPAPGSSAG